MVPLAQLWLPILLSAVVVFIASSVLHMVLKFWHTTDCKGFSNEEEVRSAIRKGSSGPALYMIPYCSPDDMKKAELQQKFKEGPIAFVFMRAAGALNMGASLGQWFVYCLLVALFAAYIGAVTLAAGTPGAQVFRVVGTAALLGYAFGSFPMAIWWGQAWRSTIKYVIDGIIYAVIVGAVFMVFWPK